MRETNANSETITIDDNHPHIQKILDVFEHGTKWNGNFPSNDDICDVIHLCRSSKIRMSYNGDDCKYTDNGYLGKVKYKNKKVHLLPFVYSDAKPKVFIANIGTSPAWNDIPLEDDALCTIVGIQNNRFGAKGRKLNDLIWLKPASLQAYAGLEYVDFITKFTPFMSDIEDFAERLLKRNKEVQRQEMSIVNAWADEVRMTGW